MQRVGCIDRFAPCCISAHSSAWPAGGSRLPGPLWRAGPAPRFASGCCHVAVNPAIGFAGQARKCLETMEPTGGFEPPTC